MSVVTVLTLILLRLFGASIVSRSRTWDELGASLLIVALVFALLACGVR